MEKATRIDLLLEYGLRVLAVLVFSAFVSIIFRNWWADTSRYTLLLLLVGESLTLALILIARRALLRDLSPIAVVATVTALFFFIFFEFAGTLHLVPEWVGVVLQLSAISFQLVSKFTLGRSFGLLPAARGLVTDGPYKLVRHPIYLGYLIAHVGFILTNFSIRNLLVLVVLYVVQVIRMLREESVLRAGAQGDAYVAYCSRVRWRIVPYVF